MKKENVFSKRVLEKPATKRASRVTEDAIDYDKLIRMGYNENPFGEPESVKKAIAESANSSHFYPDFSASVVKKELADLHHISSENIIVGEGSGALINIVGHAFLNPGEEVILCPTFAAFNDMIEIERCTVVTVPLKQDKTYDLEGILKAVTDKTKMVIITNPNNPTGTYVSYGAIHSFIERLPEDIVVLIDEAYIELATASDCKTCIPFIDEFKDRPIVILRTFSKYYALAGARIGYLIASEQIVDGIRVIPGCTVSRAAQFGALQALKEKEYYEDCKKKIVEGIAYIEKELKDMGCDVWHTQTNFIFFDTHMDMNFVKEELLKKGIHISTPISTRVTVSTKENNEYFIQCMKEILEES